MQAERLIWPRKMSGERSTAFHRLEGGDTIAAPWCGQPLSTPSKMSRSRSLSSAAG